MKAKDLMWIVAVPAALTADGIAGDPMLESIVTEATPDGSTDVM
ncbi:hypothetical protein OIT41_09655 [Arthrobacter sp. YA7-1]|nr:MULTISPECIES: hypothetical protein [Arthrobacter]UYY83275.1 hypothetical protein OIT41_09655 [Arthrobacter sp. YA7-1]